jgi:RNA polymerase sigma factor (sigma-70 family)
MEATSSVYVPAAPVSETRLTAQGITDDQAIAACAAIVGSLARRFARSSADLADLEQEGFLGLLGAAREWREDGGATFQTFAYFHVRGRILRAAMKERRRGFSRSLNVGPVASLDEVDDEGRNVLDRIGREAEQENATLVSAAFAALPPKTRRIVELASEGFTYDCIAQIVGMSNGCVRAAMQRAKKLFREQAAAAEAIKSKRPA